MKRSLAIVLLFFLVAPIAGTYMFIHFKKMIIRQEVNEAILNQLNENELTKLRLANDSSISLLNWKDDNEFEYEGHMYDVVEKHVEGNEIVLTCYKDHEETELNREKQKLIAKALNQDPIQKSQNNYLKNFFNTIFQNDNFSWNPLNTEFSNIHYSLFTIHYSLTESAPLSPPPKVVFDYSC